MAGIYIHIPFCKQACYYCNFHFSTSFERYREAMIAEYTAKEAEKKDESSEFTGEKKPWSYVRVPCLGILDGLVCPHFDKTQSNGILRAHDFDTMMLRHPKELGICIDHFAAITIQLFASIFALGRRTRHKSNASRAIFLQASSNLQAKALCASSDDEHPAIDTRARIAKRRRQNGTTDTHDRNKEV